jgi:hypothetical protein
MEQSARSWKRRLPRLARLGAVTLLAAGAVAGPLVTGSVKADVGYCRACGRFNVIGGRPISFSTFVPDSVTAVQTVAYTVHLPMGQRITHSWLQGDLADDITVTVVNDAAAGTFSIDTDVITNTDSAASTLAGDHGRQNIGFGRTNSLFSVDGGS